MRQSGEVRQTCGAILVGLAPAQLVTRAVIVGESTVFPSNASTVSVTS